MKKKDYGVHWREPIKCPKCGSETAHESSIYGYANARFGVRIFCPNCSYVDLSTA